jgi:AcrR family transcriptional regulator
MSRVHACDKPGVLDAARGMMEEVGYDSFNMRALAEHCHLAVGTLYNYFPSKYHIVQEIMVQGWTELLSDLDALVASPAEPLDKLREMYRRIREMFTRTHNFWAKGYASIYNELDMKGVRMRQGEFRAELISRVIRIVQVPRFEAGGPAAQRLSRLSDGLVRLIFSYCADSEACEDAVFEMIATVYDSMIGGAKC